MEINHHLKKFLVLSLKMLLFFEREYIIIIIKKGRRFSCLRKSRMKRNVYVKKTFYKKWWFACLLIAYGAVTKGWRPYKFQNNSTSNSTATQTTKSFTDQVNLVMIKGETAVSEESKSTEVRNSTSHAQNW